MMPVRRLRNQEPWSLLVVLRSRGPHQLVSVLTVAPDGVAGVVHLCPFCVRLQGHRSPSLFLTDMSALAPAAGTGVPGSNGDDQGRARRRWGLPRYEFLIPPLQVSYDTWVE